MNAPAIKRWLSEKFGIKIPLLRVTSSPNFLSMTIMADNRKTAGHRDPWVYSTQFPWDFGQRCLKEIYPTHPNLWENWCGNVSSVRISMGHDEFQRVVASYDTQPAAEVTAAALTEVAP